MGSGHVISTKVHDLKMLIGSLKFRTSLIHYSAFFGSEGHVALDRNPGPGYDTLLL